MVHFRMPSYFFRLISMFRSPIASHFLHHGFADVELALFREAFTQQDTILAFVILLFIS